MKWYVAMALVVLAVLFAWSAEAAPVPDAPSFSKRQQAVPPNCKREGAWTLCNDDGMVMKSQDNIGWVKEKPKRTADAKFFAVAAVPHVLNAAYRVKFGSCYPMTCVENTGLSPNKFYVVFTGIDLGFNVLGYFAKKSGLKHWWLPITLGIGTPIHIYDLQHHPS